MRLVNVVAKFLIQHNGSFLVDKGDIKIFGADDATAAVLQTEFPELQLSSPPSSSSSNSNCSILSTSTMQNGNEPMELDEAWAKLTAYLIVLDQQEFTVVSAFKDELGQGENQYKLYSWTLQKRKVSVEILNSVAISGWTCQIRGSKMPLCTVMVCYEIYEGNLGAGPLPLLSWSININGLSPLHRAGMHKFFIELQDSIGESLTYSQNQKASLPATMVTVTGYLNWLDSEGFKVTGTMMDSSVYSGGVTKTQIYVLQTPS